MDAKKSSDVTMEVTDLISFIRELDPTNPQDKETKQKLIDIYAETIYSQLCESDNECMEEFKELLADQTIRETIVNFLTSKAPAVISAKIKNQLPAINEETSKDVNDDIFTDGAELMDNILAKLDRIMGLMESATKSKQVQTRLSEKTLFTRPIIPPRPMKLLQKAFYEHPLNKWRRSAQVNEDSETESSYEPQEYGDMQYTPKYEIRTPTDYNVESTTSLSVQYSSEVESKPDESGDLYNNSDCEEMYENKISHEDEPIPDETTRYYYDSPRYYFDKMFGTPPLPLRRPTIRCREPILLKPIKPASLRTPNPSVTILQCKPIKQSQLPTSPSVPPRRLGQFGQLPQFRPASHREPQQSTSKPPMMSKPRSMTKPQSMPTSQCKQLPRYTPIAPVSRSKPLPQKEPFHFVKEPLMAENPRYYSHNIDFSNFESKPETYCDDVPEYDLRDNKYFDPYGYIAYASEDTITESSSGESHACSDPTTPFNTEGATTMSEETVAVPQDVFNTNLSERKGRRQVSFLETLQHIYKY